MSDSYKEALDALYKAAKAAANFIEATLTSKDISSDPLYKERLELALKVLQITWADNQDDDEDEDDEDEDDEDEDDEDEDDEDEDDEDEDDEDDEEF